MDDRYTQPEPGSTGWHEPLNDNFEDLGREVVEVVDDWETLQEATADVQQSSNGQWPRFYVLEDRVVVRATDEETHIVGGLGSSEHPVPEVHAESVRAAELRVADEGRVDVRVPSDFDSVRAAIEEVTELVRPAGVQYRITIESGHEVSEPVTESNVVLNHVVIESEDAEVPVIGTVDGSELFGIAAGLGPRIETVFDLGGLDATGYRIATGSATIGPDGGFRNAGANGVHVQNGTLTAIGGRFDGCDVGLRATAASRVRAPSETDVSDCNVGLWVSRMASVEAPELVANGCTEVGVRVGRGFAHVSEATINDCGENPVRCFSGFLRGRGLTVQNPNDSVRISDGARADLSGSTIVDAGASGLYVTGASTANVGGGSITGSANDDLRVDEGGIVNAHGCETSASSGDAPHEDDLGGASGYNEVTGNGIVFAEVVES